MKSFTARGHPTGFILWRVGVPFAVVLIFLLWLTMLLTFSGPTTLPSSPTPQGNEQGSSDVTRQPTRKGKDSKSSGTKKGQDGVGGEEEDDYCCGEGCYSSYRCLDGNDFSEPPFDPHIFRGTAFVGPRKKYGYDVINRTCYYSRVSFDTFHGFVFYARGAPPPPPTNGSAMGTTMMRLKQGGGGGGGGGAESETWSSVATKYPYDPIIPPPVSLASRTYDIPIHPRKARIAYNKMSPTMAWIPHIEYRPVPCKFKRDDRRIGYYSPIVAPWNFAHTLLCDLFGLFWGAVELRLSGTRHPLEVLKLQVVAVSRWFAPPEFTLQKNKAFDWFSPYKPMFDLEVPTQTIFKGLIAGTGTKTWSWVTKNYSASGSPEMWWKFRHHVMKVVGIPTTASGEAVLTDEGRYDPAGAAAASLRSPVGDGVINSALSKKMVEDDHVDAVADVTAAVREKGEEDDPGANKKNVNRNKLRRQPSRNIRVSICHKKEGNSRGVQNYDEAVAFLRAHFAGRNITAAGSGSTDDHLDPRAAAKEDDHEASMDPNVTFVLETVIGKTAKEQVEMMLMADVYMCNEGTLSTTFFLMRPGSVFFGIPLIYHGPHLHIRQMPHWSTWWQEPDLMRADPRKNTGGNIDWFPPSIPWIHATWYNTVPLNETVILPVGGGLRNYMPNYNIVFKPYRLIPLMDDVMEQILKYRVWVHTVANSGGGAGGTTQEEKEKELALTTPRRPPWATWIAQVADIELPSAARRRRSSALTGKKPTVPSKRHPNYSVNADLCRRMLAIKPEMARYFNSGRCFYGMSWLCELYVNTIPKYRLLHGKWAESRGRCGDGTTWPKALGIEDPRETELKISDFLFWSREKFQAAVGATDLGLSNKTESIPELKWVFGDAPPSKQDVMKKDVETD